MASTAPRSWPMGASRLAGADRARGSRPRGGLHRAGAARRACHLGGAHPPPGRWRIALAAQQRLSPARSVRLPAADRRDRPRHHRGEARGRAAGGAGGRAAAPHAQPVDRGPRHGRPHPVERGLARRLPPPVRRPSSGAGPGERAALAAGGGGPDHLRRADPGRGSTAMACPPMGARGVRWCWRGRRGSRCGPRACRPSRWRCTS